MCVCDAVYGVCYNYKVDIRRRAVRSSIAYYRAASLHRIVFHHIRYRHNMCGKSSRYTRDRTSFGLYFWRTEKGSGKRGRGN